MAKKKSESVGEMINRIVEEMAGFNPEFLKVVHAIAFTESGGNPGAKGDYWIDKRDGVGRYHSYGVFQNNVEGRGAGYRIEDLLNPEFNIRLSIPELLQAFNEGVKKGYSGSDLVAYVSRVAQRPKEGNEWNAAKNYGKYVGDTPAEIQDLYKTWPNFDKFPQVTKDHILNTVNPEYDFRKTVSDKKPEQFPSLPQQSPFFNPLVVRAAENETSPAFQRQPVAGIPNMYVNAVNQNVKLPGIQSASYTVQPGDTLWGVAQQYMGGGQNWPKIQGYTGQPTQMPIGTKLTIPTPTSIGSYQPKVSEMRPAYTPPPQGQPVKGIPNMYVKPVSQPKYQPVPSSPYIQTPPVYGRPQGIPTYEQLTRQTPKKQQATTVNLILQAIKNLFGFS